MVAVPINHISVDDRGVAYVSGTRIKVSHIAVERTVWQKSPEAIQQDFPHLTLGDIYAAIAYYCDHREQIDSEIADEDRFAEEMRIRQPPSITREILAEKFKAHRTNGSRG